MTNMVWHFLYTLSSVCVICIKVIEWQKKISLTLRVFDPNILLFVYARLLHFFFVRIFPGTQRTALDIFV